MKQQVGKFGMLPVSSLYFPFLLLLSLLNLKHGKKIVKKERTVYSVETPIYTKCSFIFPCRSQGLHPNSKIFRDWTYSNVDTLEKMALDKGKIIGRVEIQSQSNMKLILFFSHLLPVTLRGLSAAFKSKLKSVSP